MWDAPLGLPVNPYVVVGRLIRESTYIFIPFDVAEF